MKAQDGSTPYGQLPTLKTPDGKTIGQSTAISNLVAAEFGVFPKTPKGISALEQYRGLTGDAFGPLRKTMGLKGQEKWDARVKFATETLPKYAQFMDDAVKANASESGFVEEKPTLADVIAYNFIGTYSSGWLDGIPADCLAKYENLMKLRESMRKNEAIAKYLAAEQNQDDVRQRGWNAQ